VRRSAGQGCDRNDSRVGFTAIEGSGQQSAPMFHRPHLFWPAARALVHTEYAAARRRLPVIEHRVGDGFGNACLAQRGGE
jgi:hypothetical protein